MTDSAPTPGPSFQNRKFQSAVTWLVLKPHTTPSSGASQTITSQSNTPGFRKSNGFRSWEHSCRVPDIHHWLYCSWLFARQNQARQKGRSCSGNYISIILTYWLPGAIIPSYKSASCTQMWKKTQHTTTTPISSPCPEHLLKILFSASTHSSKHLTLINLLHPERKEVLLSPSFHSKRKGNVES